MLNYGKEIGSRVEADGKQLTKKAYIFEADEADFGCEGRPSGEIMCDARVVTDSRGIRCIKISEAEMLLNGYDDNMWICLCGGDLYTLKGDKIRKIDNCSFCEV